MVDFVLIVSMPIILLEMILWMFGAAVCCVVVIMRIPYDYAVGGRRECARIATLVADWYWHYLTAFIEVWGRWKIVFSGDRLPVNEDAIIIANHRWFLDWLMIFQLAIRKGMLGCCKLFAKDSIRWVPGIGWGIWMLDYIFLKRDWNRDSESINRTFHNLKERNLPFWLVSHIEGTRLSPLKLKQSHEFAKKKDLPILNNVLIPRSKGFAATVQALQDTAGAVYDLTIVYNDGRTQPSMPSIAFRLGGRVNIHVRRYKIEDIPKDDAGINSWLIERWAEKDKLIDHFLKHGNFPNVYEEPRIHVPIKLRSPK